MGCFNGKYKKTKPDIDQPFSRFHSKSENHLPPPPNTAMIPSHKMEGIIVYQNEDKTTNTIKKEEKNLKLE